jgi:hypothetical protein
MSAVLTSVLFEVIAAIIAVVTTIIASLGKRQSPKRLGHCHQG